VPKRSDRFIPERTVDSLLAIEIVRRDPYALIWSPTNSHGAIDHVTFSARGSTAFEVKAVVFEDAAHRWTIPINVEQLTEYTKLKVDVYYLLLFEADLPEWPWITGCMCTRTFACLACPTDARSVAQLKEVVRDAPAALRLQPWFSHWAWVISAVDLLALMQAILPRTQVIPTDDYRRNAMRLCHFLEGLELGTIPSGNAAEMIAVFNETTNRNTDGTYDDLTVVVHSKPWG